MHTTISEDSKALGEIAGKKAATLIRHALDERDAATIILATGTSQFETLRQLVAETDIDWAKVTMFHLDEYVGLSEKHPASFRKYLRERFIDQVSIKKYYLINGEADSRAECSRLNSLISELIVDAALVGIGENGHLAFNDPPADFNTNSPYIVVELDELCRMQQLGEGWFQTLEDVPRKAISMSVKQIMKSKNVICSVPDERKAVAVRNTLEQPVSSLYPASILQHHSNCFLFLDKASASKLSHHTRQYE